MQIQRLLLRLQQMSYSVLHNERRVEACCIPGTFLALLSPCCIPTVTRRRVPLAPSPFLLVAPLPRSTRRRAPASLYPPPCPLLPSSSSYPGLAPSSAAPPSPSASAFSQIRQCGGKDRGQGSGGRTSGAGDGGLLPGGRPPLPELRSRALRRQPLSPSSETGASSSTAARQRPPPLLLPPFQIEHGGLPVAHDDLRLLLLPRQSAACASSSFPGDRRCRSVATWPPGSRAGLHLHFPTATVAASSSATGAPPPPCSSSAPREATTG
jgi:hypothetical protein